MIVILAHERADFDAVSSQVGMALLLPQAVPVLPQAINENVEDFLTLYGRDLPLRRRDELGGGPITLAWQVDAPKVQSVRGMTRDTPRSLLDHHVGASDPADFQDYDVQDVGANATLVTERLQEAGITPGPVEATLLLLGIHEDTGSLTYAGSTGRDAMAVAWLMGAGANLDLLERFLRAPLDPEGRRLAERLVRSASALDLDGHTVLVCAAEAADFQGELALVAGRVMAALEPDALFLLVALADHVQLVARSGSEHLDASAVARALGGGGHPRAAAAVLREGGLAEARARVQALLEEGGASRPATRVREIMSRSPVRHLAPDMSIGEAAVRAGRFGHEGYPVLDGERLVGLVTRVELDKALRHHLQNEPLAELLQDEDVPAIGPEDTITELQRLMTERDVGQVPVVRDGAMVGIVTRTDLLRLFYQREAPDSGARSLAEEIEAGLAPPLLAAVREIAAVAAEVDERVYLVGGIPRDLLLRRPPGPDLDVVVTGDAEALGRRVVAARGGRLVAHGRFGTAKWIREDTTIDLVSARREYYHAPTALPTVERGGLRSDLRRRDFSINTLAASLQAEDFGRVVDWFGGLRDLEAGRVRVLHGLSFIEDPTRILRAVRFEQRLGFRMDADTERRARSAIEAGLLARLSGQRIANELRQLFAEPEPGAALDRLQHLGALDAIVPGLRALGRSGRGAAELAPAWAELAETAALEPAAPGPSEGLVVWLAGQLQAGAEAAERLVLTGRERRDVEAAVALLAEARLAGDEPPSALVRALSGRSERALVAAWFHEPRRDARRAIARYLGPLRRAAALVDGDDLKALGLPPGPEYGRILGRLRDAQLDGELATREDALAQAARLAREARQATAASGDDQPETAADPAASATREADDGAGGDDAGTGTGEEADGARDGGASAT